MKEKHDKVLAQQRIKSKHENKELRMLFDQKIDDYKHKMEKMETELILEKKKR